ncbi:MAG: type II toxin-antitoxin system RelE/ParE family toxin [Betaproteobacteria bacterium]|nr:type II toxin-antitoxin system RelE/ParE family toxin [Betaproteobacteria bacterium]
MEVRQTEPFAAWLRSLQDPRAKARVLVRIERLIQGNPGDVRPVGSNVSELRIHSGPGYRVYIQQKGRTLLLLLAGGTKSTQAGDIKTAIRLAKAIEATDP